MKAIKFISKIETSIPHIETFLKGFLKELNGELCDLNIELGTVEEVKAEPYSLVLVASGGPFGELKKIFDSTSGPYFFITTPNDNSLACALEFQNYVIRHGKKSEILWGTTHEIAKRLEELNKAIMVKSAMAKMRIGIIGLSKNENREDFDEVVLKNTIGTETVYIPFEKLMDEIAKHTYVPTDSTKLLLDTAPNKDEMENALCVYGAVKRIVEEYGFDAITLKCFELLKPLRTTGCVALALLNQEGICSACEGDARSLVSMVVLNLVSGKPVFMANPCRASRQNKSITFAHCTLPLGMTKTFTYDTHFESDLSIAIKGVFDGGNFTVFKCVEDLKSFTVKEGRFIASPSDAMLCRTQLELGFDEVESFFVSPINNHHMICEGCYSKEISELFKWF